ncbi:MAG: DMT family transporter [Chlorobi bacterium]|nr:DMT family transporter [Chlorobiota bacterium]MCI0716019.1 DMT family transporter [Chlorobiota bacterium]
MKSLLEKIPRHRKGLIYISVTAFLWSTSGFFIKYLTINAFQISLYRSAIAAITVYSICLLRGKKLKFEFDKVSNFAAVFYAGILILFVAATKMTTAANAIFLQFTAPIYLVVLEPIFLKTKFEPKNVITIIICIGGMILFFFGRLEIGSIYGNLIAIGSGICFAMFSLLLKYKKVIHKSENTLNYVITGNALVAVIASIIIFPNFEITVNEGLILVYMGAIQIGISYMIFNEGIKYVSATESMIIATLEAIFNPIWVFIGIGEVPSVYSILGGVIIFGAILWRNFSKPQKAMIIE